MTAAWCKCKFKEAVCEDVIFVSHSVRSKCNNFSELLFFFLRTFNLWVKHLSVQQLLVHLPMDLWVQQLTLQPLLVHLPMDLWVQQLSLQQLLVYLWVQ